MYVNLFKIVRFGQLSMAAIVRLLTLHSPRPSPCSFARMLKPRCRRLAPVRHPHPRGLMQRARCKHRPPTERGLLGQGWRTVVNKCTGPCTAGERRAYSGIFARRLQPFTAVCVVCRAEPECPMQFCTAAQPRGVGQAVD